MIDFQMLIIVPVIVGVVIFLIPESIKMMKAYIALLVSAYAAYLSVLVFNLPSNTVANLGSLKWLYLPGMERFLELKVDGLSKLIVLFIGLFGFLYALYSLSYTAKRNARPDGVELMPAPATKSAPAHIPDNYYSYYLITLGASFGVALTDNLLLFVFLWGLLGLTLFKLIKGHTEESSLTAKKALVLIGASDSILILGIGLLYNSSHTLKISDIALSTNTTIASIAFLSLLIACLTKAGAFPFHTWIPEFTRDAPASISAYLPASLDKLLGIYFLGRLCMNMFVLTSWATLLLLVIGAVTIITAVMMALIQHNFKKLLGYHAISQVGYMITG
ncbi:MAG: proton-conducting transporter membrane subunit, partial [Candidatus Cloacimonadaceae bacterium]|nr:proton-conducting transporter membrane subunit [Candidatus Cloacimonadaceae bacterium]